MTGYHPIEAAEAGFRHIVGSPDPASAIGDEPGPRHPGSLHSSCGSAGEPPSVLERLAAPDLRLGRLFEGERALLDLAGGLVGGDDHAAVRRRRAGQLQARRDRTVAEEALAGPGDHREDPEPELVD